MQINLKTTGNTVSLTAAERRKAEDVRQMLTMLHEHLGMFNQADYRAAEKVLKYMTSNENLNTLLEGESSERPEKAGA